MRRLLVGLVLSMVLVGAIPAMAQEQEHFASVKVEILPEYDQPGVLVITNISLPPASALPAQLALRIPSQATLWAVADEDLSGGLVNAAYTSQDLGEWTQLNITAGSAQVQIEYYDVLAKNGSARHITYQWPGDAAVDAFSVDFRQPIGATNLVLAPAATTRGTNQEITSYQTSPVPLAAGQVFTLTADYQKQTDDLSVSKMPAQSGSQDTSTGSLTNHTLAIAASVLAGLLLIGGAIGVVRISRNRKPVVSRVRHSGARGAAHTPAEALYCSQCGNRAQPEDVFCRACGTRLRRQD